ncbi:Competence protein A [Sporotomaculum syntrophicum]|uniref:Competence protein A n=1 Tax=Sporotomaculum syntrophicum TaxID=182264 RepID=A0A9D3B048_9FIRM|nr:type IV pilus assembly protein PilM [Sporotomaculum syntrophicum]KAF1086579.1 Competence protein A [Sporotomaculum syntrophicum]
MQLLKSADAVGLELDTGIIRVVSLSGVKHAPSLVAAGEITIPEDAVSEGVVADVDAVASALEELWAKARIGSREVTLGISNQGVLMRLTNFPKIPDNKLSQALHFQAGEYLPISPDEMVLDYAVMGEIDGDNGRLLQILLVAARRDLLDKSLQAVQKAALVPRVVDAVPLALMRTLPAERLKSSLLLADISNGLTTLLLVTDGIPRFARVIPHSLKSYACELDKPLEELLQAVCQAAASAQDNRLPGEHASDTGQAAAGSPSVWELALANDIRSSIGYYMTQTEEVAVDALIISGRGARLAGLTEYLQAEIELPVEIIDPLVNIKDYIRVKDVDLQRKGPDFAVAIGLALRGLEE